MPIQKANIVSTKKPKIAIMSLCNSYKYGGVLSSLKVMYDFCSQYFDPTVFFLGFSPEISTSLRKLKFSSSYRQTKYFGMNCIEVGARWAFWEPGHYKYTLKIWKKLLHDYHYFAAVSGTCIVAHPLALLGKRYGILLSTPYMEDRNIRIKSLTKFRTIVDRIARRHMLAIEKNILIKANVTWALSNYSREKFKEITAPVATQIIRCGHPMDCKKLPSLIRKKDKTIIALGRFSDPRKNLSMLLRTFEKIYQVIPEAELYIVGHKPSHNVLHEFSQLASFDNVIFTGQVSSDDLSHLLSISSLMLITSYQEGFGIAGLEALLHGTPIISTRCGGPQDYVIEGETGFLVDVNDDCAMATQAIHLLLSPELRLKMSHYAQRFVQNNFDTQRVYEHFKKGFSLMHPELHAWFTTCDALKQRS